MAVLNLPSDMHRLGDHRQAFSTSLSLELTFLILGSGQRGKIRTSKYGTEFNHSTQSPEPGPCMECTQHSSSPWEDGDDFLRCITALASSVTTAALGS